MRFSSCLLLLALSSTALADPSPVPLVPHMDPPGTPPDPLTSPPPGTPLSGSFSMVRVPSADSAFGGQRSGKEVTLSDHVADYDIVVTLDPKQHTLDGSETLRWRNRSGQPIATLYFHTYLNGFAGNDSTFGQERTRYGGFRSGVDTKKGEWGSMDVKSVLQEGKPSQLSYVQPDGGPATDRTVLRVELPTPVPPGATATLVIAFHDRLPRVVARTGWFDSYHLVAQFFPKIGVLELPGERGATALRWNCHELHLFSEFYADWGDYSLTVTAPKTFTVVGNGVLDATSESSGGVTHRFVAKDVHDAVFTAWDKYAAPLHGSYDGPGSPHVDVEVLFPEEQAAAAPVVLKATIDSLKYFSEQLGAYPYRHVVAIVPPFNAAESGGMEYETFFTTEVGPTDELTRYVTIHEFGHGYFMGLLASNEFEEPFLDEGLNELFDSRMIDLDAPHRRGFWERLLSVRLPVLSAFHLERLGGVVNWQPDPLAESSWHRLSRNSYSSVYQRTVAVFHDLEQEIGTAQFEKAFHLYYDRWKFRHPSTADLQAAFRDAGTEPSILTRVFDEAVYGAGVVDDAIQSVHADELTPEPGLVWESGAPVERTEEDIAKLVKEKKEAFDKAHPHEKARGPFGPIRRSPFGFRSTVTALRRKMAVPQTLQVTFEDGSMEEVAWPVGEAWHRWEFVRPVRIHAAALDPSFAVLLDGNKLDDAKALAAHPLAARRWWLELAAAFEAVLALGGSL